MMDHWTMLSHTHEVPVSKKWASASHDPSIHWFSGRQHPDRDCNAST